MDDLICTTCFNKKIAEDVYLLDVLARTNEEIYPRLIGRLIVNIETKVVGDYISLDIDEEYLKLLYEVAYSAAITAKEVIDGKEEHEEN